MWHADPSSVEDIYDIFAGYVERRVPRLPWYAAAHDSTARGAWARGRVVAHGGEALARDPAWRIPRSRVQCSV
jgi:hypothetical protein